MPKTSDDEAVMVIEVHTEPKIKECGGVVYLRTARFSAAKAALSYVASLGDKHKVVTVRKAVR